MNLKLDNQLALVTGSSGGIGLEIARFLAVEGARVIVNGRSSSSVHGAIGSIRSGLPEGTHTLHKRSAIHGIVAIGVIVIP